MFVKLTRCLAAAALSLFVCNTAAADADATGTVHREAVDVAAHRHSAIGKLFNEAGGACTGVAIARDKVLTAAHCVYNDRTRRFLAASSLHFMAGYRLGRAAVHATVASYEIGAGYDPVRWAATMNADWAILTLSEPLPEVIAPLRLAREASAIGTRAAIAGYAQERAHLLTSDSACTLVGDFGGLMHHTCRGAQGYSGAPILIGEGEEMRVAGIHVGASRSSERRYAVPAQSIAFHIEPEAEAETAPAAPFVGADDTAPVVVAWLLADRFDAVWGVQTF